MIIEFHVPKASQINDAALEVRTMTSSRNGCEFPSIKHDVMPEVSTC